MLPVELRSRRRGGEKGRLWMTRAAKERTGPHNESDPSLVRRVETFVYTIDDDVLHERLKEVRAVRGDWRTQWIAMCVASDGFQRQLRQTSATLRGQGWELVRVQGLEETAIGVRAQLVVEQRVSMRKPA
jgi:hypothetical protein